MKNKGLNRPERTAVGLRSLMGRVLSAVDREDRVRKFRGAVMQWPRDRWLRHVRNVAHVGANTGQEAALYDRYGLGVLWIEPIPEVFAELVERTKPYPGQRAYNALVADVSGKTHTLHVASNEGASSSILDFAEHRRIWPEVDFVGNLDLVAETLDDILAKDARSYDALVIAAQGAELLVLKGSTRSLASFRFIKTRAPDFNSYVGGATDEELASFLGARGFSLARRDHFAAKPDGNGAYFDLLFERRSQSL